PAIGKELRRGEVLGVVESVKAVSEIYAPLDGKVIAVNKALEDHPERVNKDPYGEGWIAELELANPAEASPLLNAAAYRAHTGGK
ncbi:MAG TPA: glycine cleavage system protein H, partial [Thermoplasmata archaeon]|nr:glycine cleavage system protein H [Thermoplasmata archaeon]